MVQPIYIVATPIGNFGDLSQRAIEVLTRCDLLAVEDTRHALKLMQNLRLNKKLIAYHDFNELELSEKLINLALNDQNIALISDGGCPTISDPGFRLVARAHQAGVPIIPIPGASAITTAIMASGLPSDEFHFYGFIPKKTKAQEDLIDRIALSDGVAILLAPPHNLLDFMTVLSGKYPEQRVFLARELTKIYEEKLLLPAGQLTENLKARSKILGECTLIIDKFVKDSSKDRMLAHELMRLYRLAGLSTKDAIARTQQFAPINRNELYDFGLVLIITS